jgi:uncharacterized membrane protein
VGLLVAGLALRLVLVSQSVSADELATRAIAVQPTPGSAYDQFLSTENTPPLFYAIEWALARLSDSAVVLRMPSLIAGMGTIFLVWLLGRRVFDWPAGLVGAGLIALSPFAAFYATEARAYALMMVCVVASTVVLLEAVERGAPRWWVGYGALTAVALWSHYTAIFVIAAQALWAIWAHPRRWPGLAASQAAVAITLLPWIPNISGTRAEGAIEELVPLTAPNVAEQAATVLVGAQNVPLGVVPGVAVGIVVGGAAATAAVFVLMRQLATPMPALRRDVVLLVAAALATPLLPSMRWARPLQKML